MTIGCLAVLRLSALLGLLSRVDQKFYEGIFLENGRTSSKKVLSSRVFLNQHFENSNPILKSIRDLLAKPDILRNCSTTNYKFTRDKSIDTFLTFNFYE